MTHKFSISTEQYREIAPLIDFDDKYEVDAPPMVPGVMVIAKDSDAATVFCDIMKDLFKSHPSLFRVGGE